MSLFQKKKSREKAVAVNAGSGGKKTPPTGRGKVFWIEGVQGNGAYRKNKGNRLERSSGINGGRKKKEKGADFFVREVKILRKCP